MELFVWALDSEVKSLHRHNVRLRIIGDTSRFNSRLQERIRKSEALTAGNTGLTLNIAANYGGRWDIVQGVKQLAEKVQQGNLQPDQIDEEMLNQHVCMHELAPVDLVIRTGGEHRISNFLLWQIAYADICFCVNTRRHRGVVSVAAGGVRHCNAGGLHAGSVGMGTA